MWRFHDRNDGIANTAADVSAGVRELAASLKDLGLLSQCDADQWACMGEDTLFGLGRRALLGHARSLADGIRPI